MRRSVALMSRLPSIQRAAIAPSAVAGRPTAMLQPTTLRSIHRSRQYGTEAARVAGTVAGSGEATAISGGTPTACSSGDARADPPLPSRPDRNPTPTPMSTTAHQLAPAISVGQWTTVHA